MCMYVCVCVCLCVFVCSWAVACRTTHREGRKLISIVESPFLLSRHFVKCCEHFFFHPNLRIAVLRPRFSVICSFFFFLTEHGETCLLPSSQPFFFFVCVCVCVCIVKTSIIVLAHLPSFFFLSSYTHTHACVPMRSRPYSVHNLHKCVFFFSFSIKEFCRTLTCFCICISHHFFCACFFLSFPFFFFAVVVLQ